MKYLLFPFTILLLSCTKKEGTSPQSTAKVTKITQRNANYKDYSGRPQSIYEYDKSTGLLSLQTILYYNYTDKRIYKPIYSNGHLVKLQLGIINTPSSLPIYETITELTYDSKGRLSKSFSIVDKRLETLEYNGNDIKPIKATITDNNKLFAVLQLKWVNDNLTEIKHFGSNNILSITRTYKYDSNPNYNQLISKEYYIQSSKSIAYYFSKNNIIEETVSGIQFVKPIIKHKFIYNSQNLPSKILMEDDKDNVFWGVEIEY